MNTFYLRVFSSSKVDKRTIDIMTFPSYKYSTVNSIALLMYYTYNIQISIHV